MKKKYCFGHCLVCRSIPTTFANDCSYKIEFDSSKMLETNTKKLREKSGLTAWVHWANGNWALSKALSNEIYSSSEYLLLGEGSQTVDYIYCMTPTEKMPRPHRTSQFAPAQGKHYYSE